MRKEQTMRQTFGPVTSVNVILVRKERQLFFWKKRKYLLLRRAGGWAAGSYALPAGHLEGNEPVTLAAARELFEETGVKVDPGRLKLVHVMHRSNREDDFERLDMYFLATSWTGEPFIAEPDRADAMGWYSVDELPATTHKHAAFVLAVYRKQILSERNWDG
jgi:8-oxo-dGTP diphosphatase